MSIDLPILIEEHQFRRAKPRRGKVKIRA